MAIQFLCDRCGEIVGEKIGSSIRQNCWTMVHYIDNQHTAYEIVFCPKCVTYIVGGLLKIIENRQKARAGAARQTPPQDLPYQ
jgi:hypothetical protein